VPGSDTEAFGRLAAHCAPGIDVATLRALITTESSWHPFAIGVVGGHLVRQPRSAAEAVATARALAQQGYDFSMGLAQINRRQLARYGHTVETILDPCSNLQIAAAILADCHRRAVVTLREPGASWRAALNCYYSGNFTRGLRAERNGLPSYVDRVVAHIDAPALPIAVVRDAAAPGPPQPTVPASRSNQRDGGRPAGEPGSKAANRWVWIVGAQSLAEGSSGASMEGRQGATTAQPGSGRQRPTGAAASGFVEVLP